MALTKITTSVVAVNSLTTANIADNSIDATKIASNSILTRHIDDAQITTDQILDGTIATADIADDAVTAAKLANSINTDIATGPAALPKAGGTMTGNLTLNGADIIKSGSADMTLDSGGRIILSADDNGEIRLQDGSSIYGQFKDDDDRFRIESKIQDKDMMFVGNDGGSEVTALRLSMSAAGKAIFNAGAAFGNKITTRGTTAAGYGVLEFGTVNINNNVSDGTVDFAQGLAFTANASNEGAWTHAGICSTGSSGYNGNLVFGTDGNSSRTSNVITERMRIDSSGHVGIGMTPAPIGSDTVLSLYNSATPRIKLHNSTTGSASGDGGEINMSGNIMILENRENAEIRFYTNGAERLQISNNGNLEFKSTTSSFTGASSFTNHTNGYLYLRGGSAGLILSDDSNINTIQIIDGSSGYIKFETADGTERMRIKADGQITTSTDILPGADVIMANGRGISFAAAGNAGGMSSELLDDYEEGTWTPDLRNNTSSFSTQTWQYGPQATYTKIGRMVYIHLSGKLSGVAGNSTGELRIFGLPFSPHTTGGYQEYRMNFFLGNQPNSSDSDSAFAFVRNGGSDFGTRLLDGGDTIFTANRLDNDTFFSIFGCYNTA